ncbi:unnamed protein product [Owenia fusiformis]|uniref:Uncharacterized protein n=1 Tax=Owenia fusiformis TaxID=6347 RepID=A0A8J1XUT4_OWEFU|nr:unnamed protein product [Owenia fusiformis]
MPLFNLSPSSYLGLSSWFNQYARGSTLLGKQELRAVLSKHGLKPTDSELQSMIDEVSVESNGIGFQAFIDLTSEFMDYRDQEKELAEAFRIYDRSGSGEISKEDLEYCLNKMGNKSASVDSIIAEADKNNDGKIQYDEFVDLMKGL